MMYLRIEMWPKGDRKRAYTLAEATLENTGGSKTIAGYLARISKRGGFKLVKGSYQDPEIVRVCSPASHSVWKEATVEEFPRARLGVWDLLHRVLFKVVGERNKLEEADETPV